MDSAESEGSGLGRSRLDTTTLVAEAGEDTDRAPQGGLGAAGHQDGTAACRKGGEEVLGEDAWDRGPVACRDNRASEKNQSAKLILMNSQLLVVGQSNLSFFETVSIGFLNLNSCLFS